MVSVILASFLLQAPTAVAFTDVGVVDVDAGRVIVNQTVVIVGNRIRAVGPSRSTEPPPGARIIAGRGRFLIPGLWDMHVHAVTPWFGEFFMPAMIAHGVTGVRDPFTTAANVADWRQRVSSGASAGPRVGTFGALVDGDPPIWPGSIVATTPERGRAVVDSLKAGSVGFVKVYSRLSAETFLAIAERSRQVGIPFDGHVPSLVRALDASKAGMRAVEHLQQAFQGCSSREDEYLAEYRAAHATPKRWDSAGVVSRGQTQGLLDSFDRARCERLADQFKASGTWMVATTTVLRSIAYLDDTTMAADPRLEGIPAFLKNGWNPKVDFRFKMLTPDDWARRKRVYARQLDIAALFHRRGVKFLAGTDLANPYLYPGSSLHDELVLLQSVGLSPREALAAATTEAARFLGVTDSLGAVAQGKLADLVLLDANPLDDVANVKSVRVVVADGRVYDEAARATLLAEQVTRAKAALGGAR